MIRRCLSYLLISLIALQPVVSIADAHQFQQSGTEHLTVEHEHQHSATQSLTMTDLNVSNIALETADANQPDCDHCCHCHGSSQIMLTMNSDNSFNTQLKNNTSLYSFTYLSYLVTPDNPPPIS